MLTAQSKLQMRTHYQLPSWFNQLPHTHKHTVEERQDGDKYREKMQKWKCWCTASVLFEYMLCKNVKTYVF